MLAHSKVVDIVDVSKYIVERKNVAFEDHQLPSQVGRRQLSCRNWKGFVLQLLPVHDNRQVVEGRVNGHTAVNPSHL